MNLSEYPKDLVCLVADKNMEAALRGILLRCDSLGIIPISFDLFIHPQKDPGCLRNSDQFLRSFTNRYRHALVMFDKEGCGKVNDREQLEAEVEQNLAKVGWQERCVTIVLDPELEIWVWTHSPHVAQVLGWSNELGALPAWLKQHNYLHENEGKPERPKEAMEAVLKAVKKPRSSSIYLQLAQRVSLQGHREPAFIKFKTTLQRWFASEG